MPARKYNPADYVGQALGTFAVERIELEPRKNQYGTRAIAIGHCINCGAEMSRLVTALRLSSPKYCRSCPAEFKPKRPPSWNCPADPEDYVGKR